MTRGGDDYIVEFKVKNAPLFRAMRAAGFQNAAHLHEASGISYTEISNFLNLKKTAKRANGDWRKGVIAIAKFLRQLPEDLFPPQHYEKALKKNKAEATLGLGDIALLVSEPGEMDDKLDRDKKLNAVRDWMEELLPPRHQQVISMRFGLDDGEPKSAWDVGAALDPPISATRVQQIQTIAMRKLQKRANLRFD